MKPLWPTTGVDGEAVKSCASSCVASQRYVISRPLWISGDSGGSSPPVWIRSSPGRTGVSVAIGDGDGGTRSSDSRAAETALTTSCITLSLTPMLDRLEVLPKFLSVGVEW